MPKFKHDCEDCKFLGTFHFLDGEDKDFYVCGRRSTLESRTFIMRNSDEPSDYASAPLFCCAELTELDKIALINGLELTEKEHKKLLEVFCSMWKNTLSMKDHKRYGLSEDLGNGNVAFNDWWDR